MIIGKILETFPKEIIYGLGALLFAFIFWNLIRLIRISVKSGNLINELNYISNEIDPLQGCQIENLPLIEEIFEESLPEFKASFSELTRDSADIYEKAWIASPDEYFNQDKIGSRYLKKKLTSLSFLSILTVGFSISFAGFIALIYTDVSSEQIKFASLITALPVFITLLFSLIQYSFSKHKELRVKENLRVFNLLLSAKLPVFSEKTAMSRLVRQFFDYDGRMLGAVDNLTEKIDDFTSGALVNAVIISIEEALHEAVYPYIERSNEAILALAADVAKREDEGMKALALNFAASVSSELGYHIKPLVAQIENLSHSLSDSKNFIDVISKNVNMNQKVTEENLAMIQKAFEDYDESRKLFSEDVNSISASLAQQNSLTADYKDSVGSHVEDFKQTVATLNQRLAENDQTLKQMLEAVFVEARTAQEDAQKSRDSAHQYIADMQNQINTYTEGMRTNVNNLLSGLDSKTGEFFSKYETISNEQHENLLAKNTQLMESMSSSARAISQSTNLINNAFIQIEEARALEEESRKKKKSFFKKN